MVCSSSESVSRSVLSTDMKPSEPDDEVESVELEELDDKKNSDRDESDDCISSADSPSTAILET